MFGKHKKAEDPDLTTIITVSKNYEAEMVIALLKDNGIPAMLRDRETGDYLRIVGWGTPFGIDIMVNKANAAEAMKIARHFEEAKEEAVISEEELAREALEAAKDPQV